MIAQEAAARDECYHTPGVAGPCDGPIIIRWTYTEGRGCWKFNYGGCGGNSNNFKTKKQCIVACT